MFLCVIIASLLIILLGKEWIFGRNLNEICHFFYRPMGQFLEKPKVEKHNDRGKNDDVRYGLGSMQGWR